MAAIENVLVFCVDSLRADRLDRTAHRDVPTPNIDEVRDAGRYYPNAFASATSTSPSVTSLLTGSYPFVHGVESLGGYRLNEQVPTAADVFRENGYETSALVTGPLTEDVGLADRFDDYRYRKSDRNLDTGWRDELVEHVHEMQDGDRPSFSYVHFWELHWPCTLPHAPNPHPNEVDYALEYFDSLVEDVLDAVDVERTLLVLTADHGESMPQTDLGRLPAYVLRRMPRRPVSRNVHRFQATHDLSRLFARVVNAPRNRPDGILDRFTTRGHGYHVLDYLTNVPLVLRGPGVEAGRVEDQVRHVDLLPTLVEVLDLDADDAFVNGEPLPEATGQSDGRLAYAQASGGILEPDHWIESLRRPDGFKYLRYRNSETIAPELYNVAEDPLELKNVVRRYPDVAEELERALLEVKKDAPEASAMNADQRAAIEQNLKELGYL